MKATNIDNQGKQRKLKDLVPGDCVFPFKYRRKDVMTCQNKKDGKWCATSVDETGKMKTWGFCKTKKTKKNPRYVLKEKSSILRQGDVLLIEVKHKLQLKEHRKSIKLKTAERNNVLSEIRQIGKTTNCALFFSPDADLQFLGRGVARVYLSCFNAECKRRVAVRLMSIDNNLPYDKTHPNKLEMTAYNKFNSLLQKNITQHLPYKIKNFQCTINELELTPIRDAITNYKTLYSYGDIKKKIDVLITEFCKYGNSKVFLKKNLGTMSDLDLKIFIFQFMSGLVTLQYHIPVLNTTIFIVKMF